MIKDATTKEMKMQKQRVNAADHAHETWHGKFVSDCCRSQAKVEYVQQERWPTKRVIICSKCGYPCKVVESNR